MLVEKEISDSFHSSGLSSRWFLKSQRTAGKQKTGKSTKKTIQNIYDSKAAAFNYDVTEISRYWRFLAEWSFFFFLSER